MPAPARTKQLLTGAGSYRPGDGEDTKSQQKQSYIDPPRPLASLMMESTELLESSLSWSEFWATMACGAVALGLVIEYRSELKKTIAERIKLLPIGALLVTLGVMLEFGFQIRTSLLVAEVRSIQQQHVAATNERAAKAEKEAAEAKLA